MQLIDEAIILLKLKALEEPKELKWWHGISFCGQCGRHIEHGFKYCPNWGRIVKWK